MDHKHKIDSAAFNIRFGSKSDLFEEESALASFIKDRLLPVVDEVLSAHAENDAVIRIDTLELELGRIPYSGFRETMEHRLREDLTTALRDKIRSLKTSSPTSDQGIIPLPRRDLEILSHFLLNSVLPWTADTKSGLLPDQRFQDLLTKNGAGLVRFLRSNRHRPLVIRRLVRQFSRESVQQIIWLLSPGHSQTIYETIRGMETLHQAHPLMPADAESFSELMWELAIGFLLNHPSAPFLPEDFISWAVRQMARQQNTDPGRLKARMAKAAEKTDSGTPLPSFDALKAVLVNTIVYGITTGFQEAWYVLVRHHPSRTAETIRHHGRQAAVRQNIVRFFNKPHIRELIRLLEPDHDEFISGFARQEALHRCLEEAAGSRPPDESRKQVWEFILAYLLRERGSQFNRKMFVRSVIRQMAARYNTAYADLLSFLHRMFRESRTDSHLRQQILAILGELRNDSYHDRQALAGSSGDKDASDRSASEPEPDISTSDTVGDKTPGVEVLLQALTDTIVHGITTGFREIWPVLVRHYPAETARMIRHHGKQVATRQNVVRFFGEPQLRELMVLIEPDQSEFISGFARQEALHRCMEDAAASRPPDESRKQVWEFVLTYLLAERGSQFNRKMFVGSVIRQMAARYNAAYADLLSFLRRMFRESRTDSHLRQQVLAILNELGDKSDQAQKTVAESHTGLSHTDDPSSGFAAPKHDPAVGEPVSKTIEEKETASHETDEIARLRAVLVDTIVYGTTTGFRESWSALVSRYPSQAADIIRYHGKQAETRKNIIRFFDESRIRELVGLIEPEQSGFITAFAGQEALTRSVKMMDGGPTASRKPVWEFVLTFLLTESGSRFNQKMFVRSVIRQMADRYNSEYGELLAFLHRMFRESKTDSHLRQQVLTILTELKEEQGHVQTPAREQNDRIRKVFRGHDLHDAVKAYLLDGQLPQDMTALHDMSEFSALTDALRLEHPELLRRLIRELQHGPDLYKHMADNLSESAMTALIKAVMAVFSPSADTDPSDFFHAVNRLAAQAGDKNRFYKEVLLCIADGRPVDFEEIVTKSDGTSAEGEEADKDARGGRLLRKADSPSEGTSIPSGEEQEISPRSGADAASGPRVSQITERRAGQKIKGRRSDAVSRKARTNADSSETKERERESAQAFLTADGKLTQEATVALWDFLSGKPRIYLLPQSALRTIIVQMAAREPERLYDFIRDHLTDRKVRERWLALLPERWRIRVLYHLSPGRFLPVLQYADMITDTCASEAFAGHAQELNHLKWRFIFAYIAETEDIPFSRNHFVRRFAEFLARKTRQKNEAGFYMAIGHRLAQSPRTMPDSETRAMTRILEQIAAEKGKRPEKAGDETTPARVRKGTGAEPEKIPQKGIEEKKTAEAGTTGGYETISGPDAVQPLYRLDSAETDAIDVIEDIYVENAGMVIAAPYLPRLWTMLRLTEKNGFRDQQAAERAVHLLQFMVDKRTRTPEYELMLNKLLCGIKIPVSICRGIDITDPERDAVEGLIRGMIQNWKIIGNTSVQGFRESFLQRGGHLVLKNDAWYLKVEQRAFDMLLDRIPWSFSSIKHPWMERIIFVEWR